jgi:hypothetical protein
MTSRLFYNTLFLGNISISVILRLHHGRDVVTLATLALLRRGINGGLMAVRCSV